MYSECVYDYSYRKAKLDKKAAGSGSLFAAADAFSELLDEESADTRDTITSNAVINRGKTGRPTTEATAHNI